MKNTLNYDEVPEITDFSNFRPLAEVMPADFVQMALNTTASRKGRGKQKSDTKTATTLRLDQDVLAFFKKDGKGYQTRINQALREYMAKHQSLPTQ